MQTITTFPGPAGTLELAIDGATSESSPYIALICHPHPLMGGTMQNKVVTTLSRAYNLLDIPAIRFNYRGVGQSQGTYDDGKGETDDALAVWQWAQRQWQEPKLLLAGFSFGGSVALTLAHKVKANNLITVAPSLKYLNDKTLSQPNCPWLLIQGEDDEVVDPEEIYAWWRGCVQAPTLVRVAEGSHFFHGKLIELRDIVVRFLQKQLGISTP